MATFVTIDSPAGGAVTSYPFPVTGHTDAGATVKLYNDATGELLGVATADGSGNWTCSVNGQVAAMRAAVVTPSGGGGVRRAAATEARKTATVRRSGGASANAGAAARRSGAADPRLTATARRSTSTTAAGGDAKRRSSTAQGQATGTPKRSGKAQPDAIAVARRSTGTTANAADTTAPSVGTLTVPNTTGTSITGITASATDAVGVTKWMIKEAATDSFTAPVAGDAGWTSITSTTSFSSSALTFTSGASATGTRYYRFYACDSAGNVGASATATATITIAATGITYLGKGSFAKTSGPTTHTLPSGIQAGDFVLLRFAGDGYSGVPAGWTQISGDNATQTLCWKRATGAMSTVDLACYDDSEGGTYYLTTQSWAFRGVHATTPIDVAPPSGGPTSLSSSTTHTVSGISPSAGSMVVFIDGLIGNAAPTGVGGSLNAYAASNNADGALHIGYDSAANGATSAPSMTFASATGGYVHYFALKAA